MNGEFYKNKAQYIYIIISYKKLSLRTTHNHKILANHNWKKEDQVKHNNFHKTTLNHRLNLQTTTELNLFKKVKLLDKTNVFDMTLHEYFNFIIHDYIIHNSIEQDSDLILMLYQNTENSNEKIIDIVIAKHRNGPVGNFQLLFHADTCKFSNIEKHSF